MEPTQTPPPELSKTHARRSRVEAMIAIVGGMVGFVGALAGLDPTAQIIIGTAVAVVLIGAGVSYLRASKARRNGR